MPKHKVIRTVLIADLNPANGRVILTDMKAGTIGTLVCLAEDLNSLVLQLEPVYLRKAESVILPEDWEDPLGTVWL